MSTPGNQPPHEDTSRPVDLSRYRRSNPAGSRPNRATEMTTSLTGWILGNRGRPPTPAPEPKPRTGRVIAILAITLTLLVAVASGVTYLAYLWVTTP